MSYNRKLEYVDVNSPHYPYDDFYYLKVIADRILTPDEYNRLSGCLGYALREVLAGESLSDPDVEFESKSEYYWEDTKGNTILLYYYDSTKSQRDDPDYLEAFNKAETYIKNGTPIRKTNRAGANTQGTRLVEGIGEIGLTFMVH